MDQYQEYTLEDFVLDARFQGWVRYRQPTGAVFWQQYLDRNPAQAADIHSARKLLDKGPEHCAKKLGEEAIETVIATVENDRDHLIAESADLLFHLLVVLKSRGVTLSDVELALEKRTAMSGLEEKAARKRD